jgi:hypothetical protein
MRREKGAWFDSRKPNLMASQFSIVSRTVNGNVVPSLLPPFAFNVTTDDDPNAAHPFIKQLADSTIAQAGLSGVKPTAARRYYFDITAYAQGADVDTPGAPLSRMSNLFYDAAGT